MGFTSSNRTGKIKTRIFALLLLMFSCSLIIGAYRSLNREFSGVVVQKILTPGFPSEQYHIRLAKLPDILSLESIIETLSGKNLPTKQVGISSVVYEQTQIYSPISKKKLSLTIQVGEENYIDLGVIWLLFGIFGVTVSILMYRLTNTPRTPNTPQQTEELDIPGLS